MWESREQGHYFTPDTIRFYDAEDRPGISFTVASSTDDSFTDTTKIGGPKIVRLIDGQTKISIGFQVRDARGTSTSFLTHMKYSLKAGPIPRITAPRSISGAMA